MNKISYLLPSSRTISIKHPRHLTKVNCVTGWFEQPLNPNLSSVDEVYRTEQVANKDGNSFLRVPVQVVIFVEQSRSSLRRSPSRTQRRHYSSPPERRRPPICVVKSPERIYLPNLPGNICLFNLHGRLCPMCDRIHGWFQQVSDGTFRPRRWQSNPSFVIFAAQTSTSSPAWSRKASLLGEFMAARCSGEILKPVILFHRRLQKLPHREGWFQRRVINTRMR